MTTKVLISIKVTPAERAWLKRLADGSVAEYLRGLARVDAEQRGEAVPDEITQDTRGKYKRGK